MITIIESKKVDYEAVIDQNNRADALLPGKFWPAEPAALADLKTDAQLLNGDRIHVVQEIVTSNGLKWVRFMHKGQLVWLFKEAVIPLNLLDHVTKYESPRSYLAVIQDDKEKEGIYHDFPFNTNQSTMVSNTDAHKLNGTVVQVLAEATISDHETYASFIRHDRLNWVKKNVLKNIGNELPLMTIRGDVSQMRSEKPIVANLNYYNSNVSVNCFAKLKNIGRSSVHQPKHNYKLELFQDEACTKPKVVQLSTKVRATSEYALNSGYTDATNSRGTVDAQIWESIVASEKKVAPRLKEAPHFGILIPENMLLAINNDPQGLYSFTAWREAEDLGLKSNDPKQIAIMGNNGFSDNKNLEFTHSTANLDGSDFTLLYPEQVSDEVHEHVDRLMKFVHESTDELFKAKFDDYYSLESVIDYYLFVNLVNGSDNVMNNSIMITYDGNHWMFTAFDFEETWNLRFNGKELLRNSTWLFEKSTNRLLNRVRKSFPSEIKNRWLELRQSVLSTKNLKRRFRIFYHRIGATTIDNDQAIWHSPSEKLTNLEQILGAIDERTKICDDYFSKL
ncbi:Hypothetical protein ADU72_0240 [Pediococcus damnosus]|uniref:GW domain-containing protein n=1 Tax=Pediococcus damnosus TaxID=51663 RepID=A0ABM6A290_9LACO|nr:SH3-like domain-containing protein [Pediococcus damnosus]AMV66189.1 Hypothetical protein ADU72_0240 [Pediococcus damnosus]AMV68472.1 Hypothetical protein ADU73_0060 [Pediococcus damnosus]KJU74356.1 hypothetical protein AH70_07270 [Pediococcus damnosus LMG 28219]KRN47666.1 hypothetical protein IV84_GL001686 [Pediococcus damnosus]PIO80251.1 hypothetical protein BSQ38_00520 [Pediococcus damnosus]